MSCEKVLRPVQKREAVEYLLAAYRVAVRRGCGRMMQSRTVYHYRCERIHILLRREGWRVHRKREQSYPASSGRQA